MQLVALLGRFVLAMGVVLGLMVLAGKVARNRGLVSGRRGGRATIEVLARQPFGKNASVAVVMAGGRALVLGVTDTSVTVLAEADPEAIEIEAGPEAHRTAPPGGAVRPGLTWKVWFEQL